MELNRIRPTNLASAQSAHWIGDVQPNDGVWRFDVFDSRKRRIARLDYARRDDAEKSRALMFSILENPVEIRLYVSDLFPERDPDCFDETG